MFGAPQISNQKDMPERNILLDKGGNIALCQTLKNICSMSFLLQKRILIMIVI